MPIYFPNGAYTIRSTTYPDSYVFLEGPDAEVTGSKEDPPQTWHLSNVKGEENVVTLTNDTYSPNKVYLHKESKNTPLTGVEEDYQWRVEKITDAEGDHYYFTTVDYNWVWVLTSDKDDAQIVIHSAASIPDAAKWDLKKIHQI